ncbi:hypothetical protein OOT00_03600 [Desulfobotulus sp. H1]|uniref:Transcription factor zinc-finger domain-containing protein n=1 Tax=Desulfobotulus pelophilus TaxID=2823377 RepID=A0ABT3N6H5_9BACT|nr:hypothetical protein [Desulfobotulus pelophilus]MCW7753068.1 hypothetical protein [Desulfobotulus pelophilus]
MDPCNLCGRYPAASSCIESRIRIDGELFLPVPYQPKKKSVFEEDGLPRRCPCCGVLPGGFHHVGCFLEICPRCHGYWLSCRCFGIKIPLRSDRNDSGCRVIPFPAAFMGSSDAPGGL